LANVCGDGGEVELFGFTFIYEDGSDAIFRFKDERFEAYARFVSPEMAEAVFKKLEAVAKVLWATSPKGEVPINGS
jgi:hypothetical protein